MRGKKTDILLEKPFESGETPWEKIRETTQKQDKYSTVLHQGAKQKKEDGPGFPEDTHIKKGKRAVTVPPLVPGENEEQEWS